MEDTHEGSKEKNNTLLVPIAIVIAGIFIAGALLTTNNEKREGQIVKQSSQQALVGGTLKIPGVRANDHILGNPNADIVIVEYSDTECPFCKQFHSTMHQIIDEYGKDGTVAWVYRHFPLSQLHPKAPKEAEATECATEQGGNPAFWAYTDRLYEITPSNNGLDLSLLPVIAEYVGLDKAQFQECLDSDRYKEVVENHFNEAIAAGGRGTPFNIMIIGNEQIEIPGAQPYLSLKTVIDQVLEKKAQSSLLE
ncbi:thioredoxin domain-containing protein [Patescibacteria group bacterium]|nr:thioredoxin domain-containing protein [Patescibacteria group bacterium]